MNALAVNDIGKIKNEVFENAKRQEKIAILRKAIKYDNTAVVGYLVDELKLDLSQRSIQKIVFQSVNSPRSLRFLIKKLDSFKFLEEFDLYRTKYRGSLLHLAALKGDSATVRYLLDLGMDVSAKAKSQTGEIDYSVLDCALQYGKTDNVKTIVEHEAFKKLNNRLDVLNNAIFNCSNVSSLEILISNGANISHRVDGESLLENYFESPMGKEAAKFLAKQGAKIDIQTAVKLGDIKLTRALLEKNPKLVNCVCADGDPILHHAVVATNADLVDLLIHYKARVNAVDSYGDSALFLACYINNGAPRIVSSMIRAGAKIEFRNKSGKTPLHGSAMAGNIKCFELLLHAGANDTATDSQGRTPYDLIDLRTPVGTKNRFKDLSRRGSRANNEKGK